MKRANQLQPLSRQHHLGLHVGRHAKECADNPQDIAKHWQALSNYINDMHHHFSIEDNLIAAALLPHQSEAEVATALNTLKEQHEQLNQLTTDIQDTQTHKDHTISVSQVRQLGQLLYHHIRFEERELFPLIEKYLTKTELDAIYEASSESVKRPDEGR